jgi:CheY-like chemotaxis protein
MLERIGYSVVAAADGTDGAAYLGGLPFELVVTDLRMPGLGGLEVARRALDSQAPPTVVVASGFATAEDERVIEGMGAVLLRKPFDLATALAAFSGEDEDR